MPAWERWLRKQPPEEQSRELERLFSALIDPWVFDGVRERLNREGFPVPAAVNEIGGLRLA